MPCSCVRVPERHTFLLDRILEPAKDRFRASYRELCTSYARWRYGFGPAELLDELRRLGVQRSDAVLVHSSMAAFAGFRGSVPDVIRVLQESISWTGTLLMPTLSMSGSALDYALSGDIFDPRKTPSRVGLLTEVFRRSPKVARSVHPTHSVAAWGADGDWWLEGHHLAATPCGRGTPYARLWERDGKIVLAGVDITTMTFFHYAEEILEPQMPFSPFTADRYVLECRLGDRLLQTAPMRLYNPEISRRRSLQPLAAELQKSARWQEGQIGTLGLIVLEARKVLETLGEMAACGRFCYNVH